ncbi:MAG: NAD(P)-dependent oxidoreductase, partial [Vulcanimicrobiaceae bacterium]
ADDEQLHLPLATATYNQYERMKELGLGSLDKSGVSELTFKSRHAADSLART